MSDFKSIKQLCEENPNLNNHILSLTDIIAKLESDKIDLETSLRASRFYLTEIKKYYQELDKFAAMVDNPNKSTYKELEEKLAQAEELRKKDIDELWETRINPMNKRIEEYEKALRLVQSMRDNDTIELKDLRKIIKDQQAIIDFAVGYISATPPHADKHPMGVKAWLFKEFESLVKKSETIADILRYMEY